MPITTVEWFAPPMIASTPDRSAAELGAHVPVLEPSGAVTRTQCSPVDVVEAFRSH